MDSLGKGGGTTYGGFPMAQVGTRKLFDDKLQYLIIWYDEK